jgi:hypothetical protein
VAVISIASQVPFIGMIPRMSGNPREHGKAKGFWDGGARGHGNNKEASGRPSGLPGMRKPQRVGVYTDIEFPLKADDVVAAVDEHHFAGDPRSHR